METIIITGAGGGIGEKTVVALAQHGRRIVCLDASDASLTRLAQLIEKLPGTFDFLSSTLDTAEDCRRILEPYRNTIRSLAHLAGVFEKDADGIDDMSVYHRAITANLTSA